MRGRERVISRQKPDLARDETRVSADVGEKKKFKFETFLQNQLNFSAIFTLFSASLLQARLALQRTERWENFMSTFIRRATENKTFLIKTQGWK